MDLEIDLVADLNAEDDDGLGWSTLNDARNTSQVHPGGDADRGEPPCEGGGSSDGS
jgi:hypothetical protein